MFDRFKRKEKTGSNLSKRVRVRGSVRGYSAGIVDRLTHSFAGSHVPINEEIKHGLRRMRARSRDICMNNDYAKRFVYMVKSNVIGVNGIKLQSRALNSDGSLDELDNKIIERGWREWGRPDRCSSDRKLSWRDIENLAIASVARDGEVLIHLIDTPGLDYGLRLRILPAEYLDENFNGDLSNGNRVVLGIEYNDAGVVVAYHIRKRNVKAWVNVYPERDYRRIPAQDMIHLHITDYPEQARGVPWLHTAIRRLHMIGKYEEAELVAAAIGASKMGFIKSPTGDTANLDDIYDGDDEGDDDGEAIQQMEAGTIEQLADGEDFVGFDPTHPTTAFDGFMRAVLRGAASGLNVAYHGISNDLENVNFSSIRAGVLMERDEWRAIQSWLIEHLHQRVYERWLPSAILHGRLNLPMKKVDTKYTAIHWQPRGWPWVDPKKDAEAARINLGMGVETRQNILSQQGRDFDETLEQLAYEQKRADALGVIITDFEDSAIAEVADDED
jgi:lambda family phage portal protein